MSFLSNLDKVLKGALKNVKPLANSLLNAERPRIVSAVNNAKAILLNKLAADITKDAVISAVNAEIDKLKLSPTVKAVVDMVLNEVNVTAYEGVIADKITKLCNELVDKINAYKF